MTKNDIFSTRKLSGGFSAENGHWGWDGWKGLSWSNSCLQWRVVILLIPTSSSLPPLWSIPAQAGIPLACTPTSMHLALDELIWFVKLVLVLLRWWVETHSQGSQSKARAVTGWGSKVLGGGSEDRRGQGGKQKGVGRCCIGVYPGSLLGCQSPFCVRRLEQKRETGTCCSLQCQITRSNCIGKKALNIQLLQQKKCGGWQLKKGKGDLFWEGRGADKARHPSWGELWCEWFLSLFLHRPWACWGCDCPFLFSFLCSHHVWEVSHVLDMVTYCTWLCPALQAAFP